MIKEITINNLYNKYDVTIDLEQDCSILIGENGVGKSTILKFLQAFLSGDYLKVGTFIFDSIDILYTDNSTCTLLQNDFCVPYDIIHQEFQEKCIAESDDKVYLNHSFSMMLRAICERKLLGVFLYDLTIKHSFSPVISNIISDYMPSVPLLNMEFGIDDRVRCYINAPLLEYDLFEPYVTSVIFGDMLNKIVLDNSENNHIHYHMKKGNEITEAETIFSDISVISDIIQDTKHQYRVGSFYEDSDNTFFEFFRGDFIMDDFETPDLLHKDTTFLLSNINCIIASNYYTDVDSINNVMFKAVYEFMSYSDCEPVTKKIIQDILFFFDYSNIYLHTNYIMPVLIDGSPYKVPISPLLRKLEWYIKKDQTTSTSIRTEVLLLKSYMSYFNEIKEIICDFSYVDETVTPFQDLVSQYITDKIVSVTPAGLKVYQKESQYSINIHENDYNGEQYVHVVQFGDEDSEISLDNLSSGECKIIALCFLCTNSCYSDLLMDEPELSISIIWQQKLVRDLLDYGQFRTIIIATHSPYIARDASLADYIKYLP